MTARDEAAIAPLLNPDHPQVGTRAAHGTWKRPQDVQIEAGCLVWRPAEKYISTKSDPAMFERFLSLSSGHEKEILRFAKRYGVLMICKHGVPASHNPLCHPVGWEDGRCSEAVEDWRFFSRSALALLKIGAAITGGKPGQMEDWGIVYSRAPHKPPIRPKDRDAHTMLMEDCLNEWLSWAMPTFEMIWHPELNSKPRIEMKPAGLMGAIALQLALRVGRKERMATCSHCGKQYTSQRAPKTGQRNFCQQCRAEKIPLRYAHEDLRKRRREGHEQARQL